jgi:hypothetical protein
MLETKEEYDAALKRFTELKEKYLEAYGKEWEVRSKQYNALDDEIFELFDEIHQYNKINSPGW